MIKHSKILLQGKRHQAELSLLPENVLFNPNKWMLTLCDVVLHTHYTTLELECVQTCVSRRKGVVCPSAWVVSGWSAHSSVFSFPTASANNNIQTVKYFCLLFNINNVWREEKICNESWTQLTTREENRWFLTFTTENNFTNQQE